MRAYWLDTAERWSEYGIEEGSYSVENRYIKIDRYQKEASDEVNRIMDDTLRQMEDGQPTDGQRCMRPGHILLLDNGLLLWALDKMNAFGLFIDEDGQLLEPDIFDGRYVQEFSEVDPMLSSLSATYDGFYHELMRNAGIRHLKELQEHTIRVYGKDLDIRRNKHQAEASRLSGGDLAVTPTGISSSMPQIFDMYLWKYRINYYRRSQSDAFRYLCLP